VVLSKALPIKEAKKLVERLTEELPLLPVVDDVLGHGPILGLGEALLVRIDRSRLSHLTNDSLISEVRKKVPSTARVGIPVNPNSGTLTVLDNQFVVRLKHPAQASILVEAGASVLRKLSQSQDLMHIKFTSENYRKNLRAIECLISKGYLDVAEPDLIFQFSSDSLLPGYPDDPRFPAEQKPNMRGFGREKFVEAWQVLDSKFHFSRIGRPDVQVAVLDPYISSNGTDFYCPASDGANQIAKCWDATNGSNCGSISPSMSHGRAALGILAACVNNSTEIAGMAPGVKKIVVQTGQYLSATRYADILLWVGKLPVNCPNPDEVDHVCHWPQLAQGAWVISASHKICSVLSGSLEDGQSWCVGTPYDMPIAIHRAFKSLNIFGRQFGGKQWGTVLVYAAGNDGRSDLDLSPFAKNVYPIGVSNCMIKSSGDERLVIGSDESSIPPFGFGWGSGSNYGPEIDLCAIGHMAATVQFPGCISSSSGGCLFGGTSSATPEVAAAAALVLSANPYLLATEVKTFLYKGADKIDTVGGNWSGGRSAKYGWGRINACRAVKGSLAIPDSWTDPVYCGQQTHPASIPAPINLRRQ
jgi:hypothetical protein